jgi:hypothetical protein
MWNRLVGLFMGRGTWSWIVPDGLGSRTAVIRTEVAEAARTELDKYLTVIAV